MLTLVLLMLAGAPAKKPPAPPPPPAGPTAAETAKLFFLAGDLQRAQEWAQRGLKREPKTCGPLNKLIAEYNFLANHLDELTVDEAKKLFDTDRTISPTVRGKLTEKAWERYVTHPLELAESRAKGDVAGALALVDGVLSVDAKNEKALALRASLRPADAGR